MVMEVLVMVQKLHRTNLCASCSGSGVWHRMRRAACARFLLADPTFPKPIEGESGATTLHRQNRSCCELRILMPWIILFIAGLFEVTWAIGLKYTEGFTKLWPSVGTLAAMALSVVLLGIAMRSLPVGTA